MNTKKDEALKLALEALGEIEWSNNSQWQSDRAKVAITTIREALAEQPAQQQSCDSKIGESETQSDLKFAGETQAQQQEPEHYCVDAVAWETFIHDYDPYISGNPNYPWQNIREGLAAVIESATPASKPWVGLTPNEKKEIERLSVYVEGAIRHTEAKLKEKNNG